MSIRTAAPLSIGLAALAVALSACTAGSGLPQDGDPVSLDPATFTTEIDNPWFPMTPGTRWTYREVDADLGELTGRPANSLLNEVLAPVDREVFRRELRYFEALETKPET